MFETDLIASLSILKIDVFCCRVQPKTLDKLPQSGCQMPGQQCATSVAGDSRPTTAAIIAGPVGKYVLTLPVVLTEFLCV